MARFVIATFYKFVPLPDYTERKQPLLDFCKAQDIKGTILLAEEGINSTIAGSREGMDAVLGYLRADTRFADLEHKESMLDYQPFDRMKVRLKKEIVTLGVPGINPNEKVGTYIDPEAWNALIAEPDVLLIDTRNDYEVQIGTFKGALNPKTESFGDFPAYVRQQLDPTRHKKVAMFCTGGIRCEKATSFMLEQGFEEVYHLKGGILRYLEVVPPEQSLWEGECFVFDQRVSVDHHLGEGEAFICPTCHRVVRDQATCPHCGG